jgi:ubiquinone/menaquinone biosynthesis C-methylase UbiE
MELNQEAYNKQNVIEQYDQMQFLFKAEEKIFRKYSAFFKKSSVLDIGIGAGRTTQYLAKLCDKYVGIDYSQNFINHCKKKLSTLTNASFEFADARSMPQFRDNSFDFILFSFNGIDCLDNDGRNLVLKECKRLLKNGGLFCFSFHNFNTIPKLFSLILSKNPFKLKASWHRYKMVNKLNPEIKIFINKDYIILRDGENNFESEIMYTKPANQLKELVNLGFEPVCFYDAEKGNEIPVLKLTGSKAQWIYTVTKVNK